MARRRRRVGRRVAPGIARAVLVAGGVLTVALCVQNVARYSVSRTVRPEAACPGGPVMNGGSGPSSGSDLSKSSVVPGRPSLPRCPTYRETLTGRPWTASVMRSAPPADRARPSVAVVRTAARPGTRPFAVLADVVVWIAVAYALVAGLAAVLWVMYRQRLAQADRWRGRARR